MGHNDLTASEREPLDHFLVVGRGLAAVASTLKTRYLAAHLGLAGDALVAFTVENGRVWATGDGFDVELTALCAYWQLRD